VMAFRDEVASARRRADEVRAILEGLQAPAALCVVAVCLELRALGLALEPHS